MFKQNLATKKLRGKNLYTKILPEGRCENDLPINLEQEAGGHRKEEKASVSAALAVASYSPLHVRVVALVSSPKTLTDDVTKAASS